MAARKGMSEKAAAAVLKMKLPEDSPLREELERHGLAATGAQAIFFALFRKAVAGDVSAAKLIREAAGEKVSGWSASLRATALRHMNATSRVGQFSTSAAAFMP